MNSTLFHGGFNGAAGFIHMQAIVVPAIVDEGTHFGKIMREFLFADVYQPQFPDTRRIDDLPALRQVEHFSESSSM